MIDYEERPPISDEKLAAVTNTLAFWLPGGRQGDTAGGRSPADWGAEEWRAAEWVVYWQNALPWLVDRLRQESITIPAGVAQRLAEIEAQSRERTRRMLDNALELLDALAAKGIEAILLKGAAIAPLYYPDPTARMMADLDLLVKPGDVKEGVEVLRGLDYRFYSRSAEDEVYLRGDRRKMIWAADNVHPVELHYALREEYAGLGYDLAQLMWRHSRRRPYWNGGRALIPDPVTLLHHVCAHATSDWLVQRGRLMQLDDIRRIGSRLSAADWSQFLGQVGVNGARFVYPALAFTRRYADLSIPEQCLEELQKHCSPPLLAWVTGTELADNSLSSPVDRTGLGFSIADRIAGGRRERLEIWFRSLFPRRWNPSKRYPRLVESPAWPLGYVLINWDRLARTVRRRSR